MAINKRKIKQSDWDAVANFVKEETAIREKSDFRKKHEPIWKEVDRQVYMQPMSRQNRNPDDPKDNRSTMELGELSRASEVLSADVNRLAFPQNRAWFELHSELKTDDKIAGLDGGEIDPKQQARVDGSIRALMSQQHLDFGLKARQSLSIKEALHHGGYVAEVKMETMLGIQDGKDVTNKKAPVWVTHSMWDCYPDSPSKTNNLFYTGSMIIKLRGLTYKSVKKWTGEGFFKSVINKLDRDPKQKLTGQMYFGDLSIPRKDGSDILLPNCKVIVVEDKVVYYKANELPHPQIIYNGYERLDVRDPYFISPLVKSSPTQKIASLMANQLVDSIEGKIEPPIAFDANDPNLVENGGVSTVPGTQTPVTSISNFKEIDIGDPAAAQAGLQFTLSELQKATGVDSVRSGMSSGAEQTATEVERTRQGGQVRTVDFVDKHEVSLKAFLYMQHAWNLKNLSNYPFFNPEMDAPDFERLSKDSLPKNIHFEVVGSKGLMEEEQRQTQTLSVTSFIMQVAPEKVNQDEVFKAMYQDAGNKSPERFLNITEKDKQFEQQLQEVQQQGEQQLQELQQQAQEKITELQEQVDKDNLMKERFEVERQTSKLDKQELELEKQKIINENADLVNQLELRESLDNAGDELDKNIEKEVQARVKSEQDKDDDDK